MSDSVRPPSRSLCHVTSESVPRPGTVGLAGHCHRVTGSEFKFKLDSDSASDAASDTLRLGASWTRRGKYRDPGGRATVQT
eukprot:830485-Rhodomonas_salina.1